MWEKRSLFYKNCLTLGPRYKTDRELAKRIIGAIEKKVIGFYKEYLQSGPKFKINVRDDLETVTDDKVT